MKTAKDFLIAKDIKVNLKNLSESWEKANALILEVMEEYAQYKVNELNKSDVIKSVCVDCKEEFEPINRCVACENNKGFPM